MSEQNVIRRRCLVLGAAENMMADADAALAMSEFEGVIAVKYAGVVWPGKLDAWVTLHPSLTAAHIRERRANGYPDADEIVSHCTEEHYKFIDRQIEYKWEGQQKSGSSGLFGVKVALDKGFTHVVLCGVPLEASYGKINGPKYWHGGRYFQQGFDSVLPHIRHCTRSMSGWTAGRLGKPTSTWLMEK